MGSEEHAPISSEPGWWAAGSGRATGDFFFGSDVSGLRVLDEPYIGVEFVEVFSRRHCTTSFLVFRV